MRQILVAVTFKEFDGGTNARIQRAFLEGIKSQTYKNYKLVVTNYHEQFVEAELLKTGIPFILHQSSKDCRWSWSEVIANTFSHLEQGQSVILWTNADVIFDPNFFEEIIKNFEPGIAGTSYPPIYYNSLEDFYDHRPVDPYYDKRIKAFYEYDPNIFIPEMMFIDGDLMLDPRNRELFLTHMVDDHYHGISVTLMFGFFGRKVINLLHRSKVSTISSDKSGYFDPESEMAKGASIMRDLCKKRGIHERYYRGTIFRSRKLLMHRQFQVVGNPWQKLLYEAYFLYYTLFPRRSFVVGLPRMWRLAKRILGEVSPF